MNIEEAKKQIKQSVAIYLAKDSYGNYRIPVEKQRPVFLLGAPGIGKTAIMEQIAKELDIALVSYSMTHHTRQSALGLPFIVQEEYEGTRYDISRYTMSEIIASVYDTMKASGKKEGILFLDEINCVSETLAPSMLQFLQYKTFGSHRVPKGWVVVTAGNPPEFNRSVREFDIATMDRLKILEVHPDYQTWRKYAQKKDIHKSILTYLDIRNDDFYQVENTVDGKYYVTARGWEDISEAIRLYEASGFAVDESLIGQYIRNPKICERFSTYYELYNKYRTDYQVHGILHGSEREDVRRRAEEASFDERITIMGLLMEALLPQFRDYMEEENGLKEIHGILGRLRDEKKEGRVKDVSEFLKNEIRREKTEKSRLEAANGLTEEEERRYSFLTAFLEEAVRQVKLDHGRGSGDFEIVRNRFEDRIEDMRLEQIEISEELKNVFRFVREHFGEGNEMLLLVTNLTVNSSSAAFIAEHGCDEYYRYNRKFMMNERGGALAREAEAFSAGRDAES